MRHAKKIVSLFLTLVMCAGFMSLSAFADLEWPSPDDLNAVKTFNDYTATSGIVAPNATFKELSGAGLNATTAGGTVQLEGGAVFSTTQEVTSLDPNTKFWGKWEAEFVLTPSQDIPSGTVKAYGQYTNFSENWVGIELGEGIPAGTTVRVIKDALPDGYKDMIADALGKKVSALNGIPFAVVAYLVKTFQCGLDVLDYTKLVPGTSVDLELRLYAPRKLTVAELTAVGAIENVNLQYDSELDLYYLLIGSTKTFNFPVEDIYVARTGDTNYTTLAGAIEAANDDTVTLLTDVALTDRVFVNAGATPAYDSSNKRYATTSENKAITLDLNGHDITSTSNIALAGGSLNVTGAGTISTSTDGLAPIEVRGTGDLTAKRTLTIGENVTLSGGQYGLNIFGSNDKQKNKIDVNINGTINGTVFVLGNLTNTENEININVAGTIDNTGLENATNSGNNLVGKPHGISLNGYATVTVEDGATVMGGSGVEVRAGNLVVNGGTITALDAAYATAANASGAATKGAAISVAQHTTEKVINVQIKDGVFTGPCALAIANPQENTDGNVTLSVTGGYFSGTLEQTVVNSDNRVTEFITGGVFKHDPTSTTISEVDYQNVKTGYVAQDYTGGGYNNYKKVVAAGDPVAKIGENTYYTLADAIEAAGTSASTIELLANAVGDVIVEANQNITLDLKGHNIVGEMHAITNNGTLVIKDTTETDTDRGCVYTTDLAAQGRAAVLNEASGTLTIESGWFGDSNTDKTDANGVQRGNAVRNWGKATINGGHFTACNTYTNGGYAYAIGTGGTDKDGSMTINNADVYGKMNGGIAVDSGTLVVNGGSFVLTSNNNYRALWITNDGGNTDVTVKGGTFTGKVAAVGASIDDNKQDSSNVAIRIDGGVFKALDTNADVVSVNDNNSVYAWLTEITGGTFEKAPKAIYLKTGFEATKITEEGDYQNWYQVGIKADEFTAVTTEEKSVETAVATTNGTVTNTFVKAEAKDSETKETTDVTYAIKVEKYDTSTSEEIAETYKPVGSAVTTIADVTQAIVVEDTAWTSATDQQKTDKKEEVKQTLNTFTATVAAKQETAETEKSFNILNSQAAQNAIAAAADSVKNDTSEANRDVSKITDVEVQLKTTLKGYTVASTGEIEKVIYDVKPVAVVKAENGAVLGNAVTLENEDLAAEKLTILFTLPVPDDLVDATQATPYVKVTHTHENNTSDWKLYEVKGSAGGYYIESESGDFSTFTLEKVVLEATGENALVAYQLTLDGSVGADFYITLNSNVAYYSNAKIRLTPMRVGSGVNTQTSTAKEYKVSELTALSGVTIKGRPVYNVFFKTYAKELYDKINIELVDAGSEKFTGVIAGHSDWLQSGKYAISVIDLAQYMYNADGVSDQGKTLAKALENFGYYTTKYLTYNEDAAMPTFASSSIPAYKAPESSELGVKLAENDYLTSSGLVLYMDAETGLRMLFTPKGTYTRNNFTFTINRKGTKETLATGQYDSTRFYALLPNVGSGDLNTVYTITVKCGDTTVGTFTRSAMNWVKGIHIDGNAGNLNYQFAEALRQYNLAADLYFGS